MEVPVPPAPVSERGVEDGASSSPGVGSAEAGTATVLRRRIAPQSGIGLVVSRGQTLTIIDPEGEQVADLISFRHDDPAERLSSGRTIDYASRIYVTAGDVLYSNRSRPMWTILRDDVGRHDFLLTPCSPEMFRILYGVAGHHPSCLENLARGLAPFGIGADAIPTTFNVFMNVEVATNGQVSVLPPLSRAGDSIELRAEMDMFVGITACSAELSNNGRFKPIDVEVANGPSDAQDPAESGDGAPAAASSA
jgi:uncharacterized protein